jgi:thiamine biosynthesis lipoprotein
MVVMPPLDPITHVKVSQNHMATTFDFTVSCLESRADLALLLLEEAHEEVALHEDLLSEFRANSEVSAFNQAPVGRKIQVSSDFLKLLELSEKLYRQTHGAFDPTFRQNHKTLSLKEKLTWNLEQGWIAKLRHGVTLGFGAIGKGYALDRVRDRLEKEGFNDYFLNAGGSSLIVSGFQSAWNPWKLSWSWKKDQDGTYWGREFSHVTGSVLCIGVSGTLEQGSHILRVQPSTELLSSWVSAPSAAEADALSTALFSLGWEEGYEKIVDPLARQAIAAIAIDEVPYWNGFFQKCFGPIQSDLTKPRVNTDQVQGALSHASPFEI